MSDFTITVIGTGAIGTSIGLALKRGDNPPYLIAHDKNLDAAKAAVKRGAFDKAEWNLINACEKANLIILATPLNGIDPTLEAITPYLSENVVVTDVCRSKVPVLASVEKWLPGHVHFVGGDPIVYPAGPGHEHGAADLFQDRLYCLTPTVRAHEEAVQLLVNLVQLLGGQPFFLDGEEHDGLITATEYLPSLLSAALLNTLSQQTSWRETRKLAGRLFEQVSAGAEGDPDSLTEGFLSNQSAILGWLDRYLLELGQLRNLVAEASLTDETEGKEALAQALDKAVVERRNWLTDYQENRFLDPELVSPEVETPGLMRRLIGFGGR